MSSSGGGLGRGGRLVFLRRGGEAEKLDGRDEMVEYIWDGRVMEER